MGDEFPYMMALATSANIGSALTVVGCVLHMCCPLSSHRRQQLSHRRDCHFHDTPCLSLLKHLIKVKGGAAE